MKGRLKTTDGYSSIELNGHTIVKVYDDYFDSKLPVTKEMSKQIAEKIRSEVLTQYPLISQNGPSVYVDCGEDSIISFYWAEDDDWKYGIKSKKKAMELAKEFVRLYMLDELPSTEKVALTIKNGLNDTHVYKNGRKIAEIDSYEKARKLYSDGYRNITDEIALHGLQSHSSKWDRSILSRSLNPTELTHYCMLLMEYMDKNWRDECDSV